MTHVLKARAEQQRLTAGVLWRVGALVLTYAVAMNLLLFLLPDASSSLVVAAVAVPLLLIGLWVSVRGTVRTHRRNKN